MKKYLAAVLLASPLTLPSIQVLAADDSVEKSVQEVKTKVYEILDKDTVTVEFKAKSSALAEDERKDLEAVVNAVRADSKVSSVIVAGWADKEYPATKGESLGSAERKLAKARSESVKAALNRIGVKTVEAHSMAEQPSWIGKMFNTKDTVVKGEGVVDSADEKLSADLGRILKENGGPGKVVVIVRREGEYEVR
jgi:hypothetical protein